jgi:DNA polymerase III gamma/tau subunit
MDLVTQGYEERFEVAEALTGKGAQGRNEAGEVLREWQLLWRDLMLIKTGEAGHIANIDFKDRLISLSAALSLGEIRAFIRCLSTAIVQARQNVNARLIMEVLMLDMPRVDKARMKG